MAVICGAIRLPRMSIQSKTFEELDLEVRSAENQMLLVAGGDLSGIIGMKWTEKQQAICEERLHGMGLLAIPRVPDHVKKLCYLTRAGSAVERLSNAIDHPEESNVPVVRKAATAIDIEAELQAESLLDKAMELVRLLEDRRSV